MVMDWTIFIDCFACGRFFQIDIAGLMDLFRNHPLFVHHPNFFSEPKIHKIGICFFCYWPLENFSSGRIFWWTIHVIPKNPETKMIEDLYDKCQSDQKYQKYCTPVILSISNAPPKTIWIPTILLMDLDPEYFEAITSGQWSDQEFGFTLDNKTESFSGFEIFLRHWLKEKPITLLSGQDDVFAINTSLRFNKNIYNYCAGKYLCLINKHGSDPLIERIVSELEKRDRPKYDDFSNIRLSTLWNVDSTVETNLTYCVPLEYLSRFKSVKPIIGVRRGDWDSPIYGPSNFCLKKKSNNWVINFDDGSIITKPLKMTDIKYDPFAKSYVFK
jgi:hypothetical protein